MLICYIDVYRLLNKGGNPSKLRCLTQPWAPRLKLYLTALEDEEESERPKPIDIEYILSNVVPSVL